MVMRRAFAALPLLAGLAAGCGDPIVVLGDTPGYMRVVAGQMGVIGERVDSVALQTQLTDPSAVAFDERTGALLVMDRGSRRTINGVLTRLARILLVDSRGRLVVALDAGGCAGTLNTLCMRSVSQAAWAPDGSLLLADAMGHRVLRFDLATRRLTAVAGTGVDAFAPDGSRAATSPLRRPQGVAVGSDGTIYISEDGSARVRRIDAQGNLVTVAGTGVPGYAGDGGPARDAQLNTPAGLALHERTLYVADAEGHVVRGIDLAAGIIETLAGTGSSGFAGDGGPAAIAQLGKPHGLALAPVGDLLFISDRENHRVRVVQLSTGVIQTHAGTGLTQPSGSRGPTGTISLHTPLGMAAAGRGFLYIADSGHYVVWRSTLTL